MSRTLQRPVFFSRIRPRSWPLGWDLQRRAGWFQSRIGMVLALLIVLLAPVESSSVAATPFVAQQSGLWEDPATWGKEGPAVPDVTIPGPNSSVTVPANITVTLTRSPVVVSDLTVASRGTLQAAAGVDVAIQARGDVLIHGQVLGSDGDENRPAGSVTLSTSEGNVVVTGRVRGGHAKTLGPGGWVRLFAGRGAVENWGWVYGGRGGAGAPGGWVALYAPQGVVRNRGEVRGGEGDWGGTVIGYAVTVDSTDGRWLGGLGNRSDGDVYLSARQAALVGHRASRIGGQRVSLLTAAGGLIDVQNVETMGLVAQDNIWLIGGPDARLYATGNQGRFPPLHPLTGALHVWMDPDQRFLDPGLTLADISAGPVMTDSGQLTAQPVLLYRTWQPLNAGTAQWQLEVRNLGNVTDTIRLTGTATDGWSVTIVPDRLPDLAPGTAVTVMVTVTLPAGILPAPDSQVRLVARAEGGREWEASLTLPVTLPRALRYFPWLGYHAQTSSQPQVVLASADTTEVTLSWPGALQGMAVVDQTLFTVAVTPGTPVAGVDLAYWDGQRWVPVAMPVDMQNLVEDGVWYVLWDASILPLPQVYVRARVWSEQAQVGETVQVVPIAHRPIAQGVATFTPEGDVVWDATPSVDLDGNLAAYAWDLGDGTWATGITVTHRYEPGEYVVRLVVTDTTGLSDEAVYVLDTVAGTWREQDACGCQSIQLRTTGPAPLLLPWFSEARQTLGPVAFVENNQWYLRANLAVEVSLTPGSNARMCRIAQWGRMSWRVGPAASQAWSWAGQRFPREGTAWGAMGYTRPSALLEAQGERVRWVLAPGWGWQPEGRGLPGEMLTGDGVQLQGVFRAEVAGSNGGCACVWEVTILAREGATPQVIIQPQCPAP